MTVLLIIKYRRRLGALGLLQMAVFRFPLRLNKQISFWKLLGTGRNGTFDKHPDWRQWGILSVHKNELGTENSLREIFGPFINGWVARFAEHYDLYLLDPIQGHGYWDGKQPFDESVERKADSGKPVATLTRATIRLSKLKEFWANVPAVAGKLITAEGFIKSYGIGEMPWIKQATFSVWETEAAMKDFAYKMREHAEVIKKTRERNWYKEELFYRFAVVSHRSRRTQKSQKQ